MFLGCDGAVSLLRLGALPCLRLLLLSAFGVFSGHTSQHRQAGSCLPDPSEGSSNTL